MLLRERQEEFVTKSVTALMKYYNTLGVAPTGSGKTIMLSSVIGRMYKKFGSKTCVLAHRDELTYQNEEKFKRFNPDISTSIYNASNKSWDGDVTFAMVQTLSLPANLSKMPFIDFIVIDEAHHAAARSYIKIIEHAKKMNPNLYVFGVTATPNRGDKKGLRTVFSNIADQITFREMFDTGFLVKPRTLVTDLGLKEEFDKIRQTLNDYDMSAVEGVMDHQPINEVVVEHWEKIAGDRQTIIFCSTTRHAHNVCQAFTDQGFSAKVIWGKMNDRDRKAVLSAYASGKIQILVNVAVLTEGFDHPPTSCVVLLRPSSFKSTMIQMIGRGLRIVNPEEYPGIVKTDCVVLDFGMSTLIHGALEDEPNLDGNQSNKKAPYKQCPECEAMVPVRSKACDLCGYEWPIKEAIISTPEPVVEFSMVEIDLLKKCHFEWIDFYGDKTYFIATGLKAWARVLLKDDIWFAIVGSKTEPAHILMSGERSACFAGADDWIDCNEKYSSAHKTQSWLSQPMTEPQRKLIPDASPCSTRYQASVLINEKFNKYKVQALLKKVGCHD